MDKLGFCSALSKNLCYASVRKAIGHRRFKRKAYYGKRILGYDEANRVIYEALTSGKPFLAARFGDAELRALVYTLQNDLGLHKSYPDYIRTVMHKNAGFFPTDDESLARFGHILFDAASRADVFGVWYNIMEDYVIREKAPDAVPVELEALEPYRSSEPWSRALKGKKVLAVHPFAKSIEEQYKKRDKLFEDPDVLPEFDLITYKTVQTNAGGVCDYDSWFDALDAMERDIGKLDYDVAIVGCGAYGLPLAARLKDKGKQVIHLAGATQILFGIRGARWDVRPEMQRYFNEYWIRPDSSERPPEANAVEGACYW